MRKVYVVVAYRWGNKEGHAYINCVCNSYQLAKFAGKSHDIGRAGKYDSEVTSILVESEGDFVKLFQDVDGNGERLVWKSTPFFNSSSKIFKILKSKDLEKELLEANKYWYCYPDNVLPLIRDIYEKSIRNLK